MDREDPSRTNGDPETHDDAHVGTTDTPDQAELSDAGIESRRGRENQADPGVNQSSTQDPSIASVG